MSGGCTENTISGLRCINPVRAGRTVCDNHDPDRQCGALNKTGGRCKRMPAKGHTRCTKHPPQT